MNDGLAVLLVVTAIFFALPTLVLLAMKWFELCKHWLKLDD